MTDDTTSSTPAVGLSRYLRSWAPEPVTARDVLAPGPAAALAATLDAMELSPGFLPPLWHWLRFLEWPPQHELGADGHPLHGHFLPPLPDRRRMLSHRLRRHLFADEHLRALGVRDGNLGARSRIASAREERHVTAEVTFA